MRAGGRLSNRMAKVSWVHDLDLLSNNKAGRKARKDQRARPPLMVNGSMSKAWLGMSVVCKSKMAKFFGSAASRKTSEGPCRPGASVNPRWWMEKKSFAHR